MQGCFDWDVPQCVPVTKMREGGRQAFYLELAERSARAERERASERERSERAERELRLTVVTVCSFSLAVAVVSCALVVMKVAGK
eukprot:COSAG01_NODE_2019_length_8634_cov_14.764499_3_plen_85_part_00